MPTKRRRKKRPSASRLEAVLPTPEQISKGMTREFVMNSETATKAMTYRSSHDAIRRWDRDGKLTDLQFAKIERMQERWQAVYGTQNLVGAYSEPVAHGNENGCEAREARQIALRDEIRDVEAIFDGVRQWYSTFERIARFGMAPATATGNRDRALTIVQFVADMIAAKGY